MAQRLYHFSVRNDRTNETIQFYGQGEKLEDAFKDGLKGCGEVFRHKNDGKHREPINCNVTLGDGEIALRKFAEWDSDVPFRLKEAPAPAAIDF